MCQMKASLLNIRLTSRYSAGSYAFAVKGLCALFSAFKIRSGTQFDGCTHCVRSVDTNLTLITCPSPKSFVSNLPDSGRHVTSVFQGLSLARFVGRVGENPGNEVLHLPGKSQMCFSEKPSPKEDAELTTGIHTLPII